MKKAPRCGALCAPAIHAHAQDTVLVAHKAAFDLRFFQLKEASTGVKFDQPVLDTLPLSAVVHPNQPSQRWRRVQPRLWPRPAPGRHHRAPPRQYDAACHRVDGPTHVHRHRGRRP